jgi:hypothetical protein
LGVWVGVDAVLAGSGKGEGEVGRIDFEAFAGLELADVEGEGAFGEADLDGLIVEIEELEGGIGGQTEGGGADVEFGAGTVAGPEAIAGDEGAVDGGVEPVGFAGGLEGDWAIGVVEAADAVGRIGLGGEKGGGEEDENGAHAD